MLGLWVAGDMDRLVCEFVPARPLQDRCSCTRIEVGWENVENDNIDWTVIVDCRSGHLS